MKFLIFLAICSLGFGGEIELFFYWGPEAKGQDCFPIDGEPLPLLGQIRKKLVEKGDEIRSWEIDAYRPWILKWDEIESWRDFKQWLGVELPRKEAMLPQTKYWVFWSLGPKLREVNFSRFPKEKLILMMWEPPTVEAEVYDPKVQAHFGKIFTWDDDLVDNEKFFKFHYPVLQRRISDIPSFDEKKFCVMIARRLASTYPKELYSERKKAIHFFDDKPGEFDLYGFFWKKKYKNWRGPLTTDKLEKLKEYKFAICYENTRDVKGYVTEKIFDCFAGGVVPVYWGASNICEYVPADCFIDRREFQNERELYDFLKAMSKEAYEGYLERAGEFLKSEKARVFSEEHFVETFISQL